MDLEQIKEKMETISLEEILNYLEYQERLKGIEMASKIGVSQSIYSKMRTNERQKLTLQQWNLIVFDYMKYLSKDMNEVQLNPKMDWVKRINELSEKLKQIDNERIKECLSMLEIHESDNTFEIRYKEVRYNPIKKSGRSHIVFLSNVLLDFLSKILNILNEEKNKIMIKEEYGENFQKVMKAFIYAMDLKSDILSY